MLSCWHDLLFLLCLLLFYLFSSFHGLVVCGWGLWTDRVFSLSPGLAQRTPNNNNNNNEFLTLPIFLIPAFFRTALPRSGGLSPIEGWDAVSYCGWGKL